MFNILQVLETMVRNCGEVVHDQVVLRGILHDMVKLAKKSVSRLSHILHPSFSLY